MGSPTPRRAVSLARVASSSTSAAACTLRRSLAPSTRRSSPTSCCRRRATHEPPRYSTTSSCFSGRRSTRTVRTSSSTGAAPATREKIRPQWSSTRNTSDTTTIAIRICSTSSSHGPSSVPGGSGSRTSSTSTINRPPFPHASGFRPSPIRSVFASRRSWRAK